MYNKQTWALTVLKSMGGMSQKQFADKTKLSRGVISIMVSGKYDHIPSLDTIDKISSATNLVSKKELMISAGRPWVEFNASRVMADKLNDIFIKCGEEPTEETIDWIVKMVDTIYSGIKIRK